MKKIILLLIVSCSICSHPSRATSQGMIKEIEKIKKRLACAEERIARPPRLMEIGRTQMTELDMIDDGQDRDLKGSRLELPPNVRNQQIMLQYNFSRYLGEIAPSNGVVSNAPWIMYHLIVDGAEQPAARAIVSGRHASHSGAWIGQISAGKEPVFIEFEYAANGLKHRSRVVNQQYNAIDEVGVRYQPYESAQVVAFLIAPPKIDPNCGELVD